MTPLARLAYVTPVLLAALSIPPNRALGESASALHGLESIAAEGRWVVRLNERITEYDHRFDEHGEARPFGAAYDGVWLDRSVFPFLVPYGDGANLGTTGFSGRLENRVTELVLGYGLTPDLTLGAIIPYARKRATVDLRLSGGNLGLNPAFDSSAPVGVGNRPLVPVEAGVVPLDATGLNRILSDPAFGFGYRPVQTTVTKGLGDPTLGALWRFLRSDRERAVLGVGVRFGINAGDDPDNLLDQPVSDGSTDLRLRLEWFRDLGAGFDLRLLGEYKRQMADDVVARVPAPGALIARAATKERLECDLGDIGELELELGRSLGNWRLFGALRGYRKGGDRYDSAIGTDTSGLEANTSVAANQWRLGLSWSGREAWREGAIPFPLVAKLELQETASGRNTPVSREIFLQVTTSF